MRKRMKRWLTALAVVVAVALLAIAGGSIYMLDFALSPDPDRRNVDSAYRNLVKLMPDMEPWVDSVRQNGLLRDTFITMNDGRRAHAIYLRGDSAHGRTAVIVHGYRDSSPKFLFLGRMYHRDLGFNILLPDLNAHGLSDGEAIQMGWKDRFDVIRWTEVAHQLFATPTDSVRLVVQGVSMGAATTMCMSGEQLPAYVRCFVEDCGYSSVWGEFEHQLNDLFSLPPFPLMYTTSALCRTRYGWSFGEASPLEQVKKCRRPMLFIHGDADKFVPTAMVKPLYEAKPQPKELWLAPGAKHIHSYIDHPEEYTSRVRQFTDKWMK